LAAPHLSPEIRSRLAEAARDSKLEPWQRQLMQEAAQGAAEVGARERSTALQGVTPSPAGMTSVDGEWTNFPQPSARYGRPPRRPRQSRAGP